MTTWILIADNSRAKLFAAELPEQPWTELETFENASAHLSSRELTPTPPGKMKQSGMTNSRHTALERRTSPKDAEVERFVHQVVNFLEDATARRAYDRLALVAPPRLLGAIRKSLGKQSAARVQATIVKDLVGLDNEEIRARLTPEVFAVPR